MSLDASDAPSWRNAAAYDYLDDLAPHDLAWECLRRNRAYRQDVADAGQRPAKAQVLVARRWGLRFPSRTNTHRPGRAGALAARGQSIDRHP